MSTQIAFFQNVQQMGALGYNKPKAPKLADPLAQAKAKFAVAVDKQAALISQACAFLDAAKQAAKGEFDALFTATNKAPRAAKEAAAPAATGENAAQTPAATSSPARKRVKK